MTAADGVLLLTVEYYFQFRFSRPVFPAFTPDLARFPTGLPEKNLWGFLVMRGFFTGRMPFLSSNQCQSSLLNEQTVNQAVREGGRQQYTPVPCDLDLWPFDLESGVRLTCDVGYFCANFSLPRPFCSRLRPDVRDRRQTASSLNAPPRWRGHNNRSKLWFKFRYSYEGWHRHPRPF